METLKPTTIKTAIENDHKGIPPAEKALGVAAIINGEEGGKSIDTIPGNTTTVNGHEIRHPHEILNAEQYQALIREYLPGSSAAERAASLANIETEDLAEMLDILNQKLQGSSETLLSATTKSVGGHKMVAVEHRYDLFEQIVQKIKHAAGHINPARLGDSLALLVVMLHPFKDGNGRTARLVGLVFQNEYDTHLVDEFRVCSMSREKARQEGVRYLPLGYAPRMPHGADQSLPEDVSAYFDELLSGSDREGLYTGTYGQADLTDSRR